MGKITRSLFLFLFLSLAGFISSCVSDVEIDSSNNIVGRTNGPPTIDEAKALLASCGELSLPNLGKNMQKGIQVRAIGKLKYDPTAVVPDWAVTQTFTEDDATILMTPLEIAAPISGITRTFVDGKENREAVQVYSKLLVKKNAARQMLGVIVTYLPDRKYWEEDGCDINKLGYELGGTNYSGIYMVSSLDGTLIHGAKFDKGELLFRFYPNWRKDMDKEHECQHADSVGHEACEHDASQAKYKLNIELLDARHNVLSRSRSTEGENFICSFCGRNAMECNCLTIDANRICRVCHNEIVNGKCRCCSVCRNSPCRCCYSCRNYPCTCWGGYPPTGPTNPPVGPVNPPTGPVNPPNPGGGDIIGPPLPPLPRPCYTIISANPLMKMKLMPPSEWNTAGATFGKVRMNGTRQHSGVDLAAEVGTPIYTMFDGEIVRIVSTQVNRIGDNKYPADYTGDRDGAGNRIYIKSNVSGIPITITYWHLQEGTPIAKKNGKVLSVGDKVKGGEVVGYAGLTGNANIYNKPHLHIGIKSDKGEWINPTLYLNAKISTSSTIITTPCD